MGGTAGENEGVLGAEGGHEGHAVRFVVKLGEHVPDPLLAMGELRRSVGGRLEKPFDVGRNIVGIRGLGEANTCGGMVVLVVGIAVHEEHLGIFPLISGVRQPQRLVSSWIWVGVGDSVHRPRDKAGGPRKHGGRRELEDPALKIGSVVSIAERKAESNVWIAFIVDVTPDRIVVSISPLGFVATVRPSYQHLP